ncbi:MAG: AAA family ATPase, partial [bacterium]|nr:AAA family ATPase [bacterium]
GQVVVLSGEAGIGKSRLVRVLKDSLLQTSCVQLESRCSPYYQHSAFYPVMELCQQLFQWQPDETPEVRLGKLEAGLARLELLADDTVHLLANLLSLPDRDNNALLYPLTPQQRRQKTLEAVLACVVALASRHPVLLIVEDLHWIDPSTLEFLTLLLDQTATTRLCLVVTCRPTFQAPWGSRSHLTQIMLSRLAHHYIEQIVMGVTGGKALPAEVLRQVIDKTDGVPLFVEECTKTVLEARLLRETADRYELVAPLPAVAIPTTLHASLLARLDRLGQAKRVAQLGATIGRQFSYALLQAVRQADEANLQQDLGRLIEAELLYQNGLPPRATYMFKHALIQDAAYQSLVRRTRQHYHQRIAQALVAWFADTVATQPELLAHHYSEAGLNEEAIPYWQQAGQQARLRSANPEAIGHLTRGLALLSRLSDTPEHTQQELNMQMTLGPALIATKGHGASEVESTYRRAQALCDRLVDAPQRFSVLRGMHTYYVVAGPLETALDLSTQLLHLAQDQMDPAILQAAHLAMGQSLFYLGKLQEAHTHLEAGLAFTDLPQDRTSPYPGAEPGMSCGFYDALVLWLLGFPDQAHARMHQALNRARTLSQPLSLAATLFFAVLLDIWRGDQHTAQVLADEFVTLSATQSFGLYGAYGTILQGWFFVMQGKGEDGLAQMHQGLEALRSTGCQAIRTHALFLFAEANGVVGQGAAELETLEEALTVVSHYGECFWEPELHRLRGERLLMQDDAEPLVPGDPVEAATRCFQHALALARGQATKSLELRAAMSLSRLWEQQGKAEEARPLLADVYGWFSEGFDTADLQRAKALLDTLTPS